jgi:hypothetical protein
MKFHGKLYGKFNGKYSMKLHGKKSMKKNPSNVYEKISWNSMKFHGIFYSMEFSMEIHGISRS